MGERLHLFTPITWILEHPFHPPLSDMVDFKPRRSSKSEATLLAVRHTLALFFSNLHNALEAAQTIEEITTRRPQPELRTIANLALVPQKMVKVVSQCCKIVTNPHIDEIMTMSVYDSITDVLFAFPIGLEAFNTYWSKDMVEGYSAAIVLGYCERLIKDPEALATSRPVKKLAGLATTLSLMPFGDDRYGQKRLATPDLGRRTFALLTSQQGEKTIRSSAKFFQLAATKFPNGSLIQISFLGTALTLLSTLPQAHRYGAPFATKSTNGRPLIEPPATQLVSIFDTLALATEAWMLYQQAFWSQSLNIEDLHGEDGIVNSYGGCLIETTNGMRDLLPVVQDPKVYCSILIAAERLAWAWGAAPAALQAPSRNAVTIKTSAVNALGTAMEDIFTGYCFQPENPAVLRTLSLHPGIQNAAAAAMQTTLKASIHHLELTPSQAVRLHTSALGPKCEQRLTFGPLHYLLAVGYSVNIWGAASRILYNSVKFSARLDPVEKERNMRLNLALTIKGLQVVKLAPGGGAQMAAIARGPEPGVTGLEAFARAATAAVDVKDDLSSVLVQSDGAGLGRLNEYQLLHQVQLAQMGLSEEETPTGSPSIVLNTLRGKATMRELDKDAQMQRARVLGELDCAYVGCTALRAPGEKKLKSKKCSGCRVVQYCCIDCQKKDWKVHKVVCKALQEQGA